MAIRIIVDSSADMEEGYARAHDITIIPMTIAFGSEQYAEGVDLSREEFFERLVETDELPRTSQIPPMVFQDLFQEAVDAGDEVVCITLSSGLISCRSICSSAISENVPISFCARAPKPITAALSRISTRAAIASIRRCISRSS